MRLQNSSQTETTYVKHDESFTAPSRFLQIHRRENNINPITAVKSSPTHTSVL